MWWVKWWSSVEGSMRVMVAVVEWGGSMGVVGVGVEWDGQAWVCCVEYWGEVEASISVKSGVEGVSMCVVIVD